MIMGKELLIILVVLALCFAQEPPSELILFVTYRDFLPINCLADARVSGGIQFIEDSWNLPVGGLGTSSNGCGQFLGNGVNNGFTEDLINLEISGHPDFEAAGLFNTQNDCNGVDPALNLNFPVGTCIFQENGEDHQIVNQVLGTGANGLPKIEYCKDDQGDATRCGFVGFNGRQTQTTKGNFDKWYTDDSKFNRRVGQRLRLDGDGTGRLAFIDNGPDSPDFDELNGFQFGPLDMFKTGGSREILLDADPADVPAWPQSATDIRAISGTLRQGFWFTTEIHTTFEFRLGEEMTFTFSGDDDFFVYINGLLAVDVGGLHARRQKTIDLLGGNDEFKFFELLNLEDGGVFTLDIYHAERQRSGSNFQLETTLFPACNILQSGADIINFERDFDDADFSERFVANGAEIQGRNIQLLSSTQEFNATHIFTLSQENVASGFEANFLARVDGDTEGFAFVIQADGVANYPSDTGRSFNINVPNSVAVVFDLCVPDVNSSSVCPTQEVRLHFPDSSTAINNANFVPPEEGGTLRVHDSVLRNLKRDEAFPINIIYFGDRPDFLEVYVNNSLYLRQSNFNLAQVIGSSGAHVGFTASSSDKAANIFIEDFRLRTVAVDPIRTKFISGEERIQTILADGVDLNEGFVIFTEDVCTNALNFGTLAGLVDAKYVELPNVNGSFFGAQREVVEAQVADNLDGTYNLQLQTVVPGEYELLMVFGEEDDGCVLVVDADNANFSGSTDRCSFVSDFGGRVLALAIPPPTPSPTTFEFDNTSELPIIGGVLGMFFALLCFACL